MNSIVNAKTSADRFKIMLALAWPVVLENLMVTLVSVVDTAMVGTLGPAATSAVALTSSPSWLLNSIILASSVGCSVLVGYRVGARDMEGARSAARQSVVLGAAFGLLFMIVMEFLAPYIPVWMGGAADVVPLSVLYFRIVALGYMSYYMGLVVCGSIRGAGDTSTPMIITTTANLLNVIGNYLLIYEPHTLTLFGHSIRIWGAGMGIAGAAAATAFSTGITGIAAVLVLFFRKDGLYIRPGESYRLVPSDLKRIFSVGLPSALERCSVNIGQLIFFRQVALLGTLQLAAHQITVTAEGVSYNPGYGFQAAATTMVSQSMGAGDKEMAEKYGRLNMWTCFVVMAGTGLLLYVLAVPYISLFTPSREVVNYAVTALRIVAVVQPVLGLSLTGAGVLRGLGDAAVTIPIALLCMWGVRIPLAIFLIRAMHMDLVGAWIPIALDLALRGVLTTIRFYSGKWKQLSF